MTSKRFDGKVVIITGASSGMGLATAELVAAEGGKVILVSRSEDKLKALAQKLEAEGGSASTCASDVSDEEGNKRMVQVALDTYGKLDGVFLNAGKASMVQVSDLDKAHIDDVMGTNFNSVAFGLKHCMAAMMSSGVKGSIVVNSSVMGSLARAGTAGMSIYAASKAAANMLVQYAAIEGAEAGIRVNAVAPGIVRTNIMEMTDEQYHEFAAPRQLMGRYGEPREIASVAAFLLSEEASFVTGSIYNADGGWAFKA